MTYYNTTNLSGNELSESKVKAFSQEEIIYSFMKDNENLMFTPFEINKIVLPNCPITSIRRAMTNLTNRNKLEKTEYCRNGDYNKKNYLWKIKTN